MVATACDYPRCGKMRSDVIESVITGSNCKECGRYGYDPEEKVYLYLITHPKLVAHKIGFGIIASGASRLDEYCKEGWSIYGIWHAIDKREIYRRESAIFRRVEEVANRSVGLINNPMGRWVDGWAESIDASAISALVIAKIIEEELRGIK